MRKAYNTRRDSENTTMTSTIIDQSKLNEFMGKIGSDIGASWSTILIYMGEKLGLYKAMGTSGQPGFKHFRRATQTPFNMVYEVKIK